MKRFQTLNDSGYNAQHGNSDSGARKDDINDASASYAKVLIDSRSPIWGKRKLAFNKQSAVYLFFDRIRNVDVVPVKKLGDQVIVIMSAKAFIDFVVPDIDDTP